MAGVPGTASAIFVAVKDVGANVIMISQVLPSSKSLCSAVFPTSSNMLMYTKLLTHPCPIAGK